MIFFVFSVFDNAAISSTASLSRNHLYTKKNEDVTGIIYPTQWSRY